MGRAMKGRLTSALLSALFAFAVATPNQATATSVNPPSEIAQTSWNGAGAAQSPATDSLYVLLEATLGVLALGVCLSIPARELRRKRAARKSLERLDWETPVDIAVPRPIDPLGIACKTPRCDRHPLTPLGRQIEFAAQASVEFGRIFGVIYFRLGGAHADNCGNSCGGGEWDVKGLIANLRSNVTSTDHVALINEVEIVAYISLLDGLSALEKIAERLRKTGQAAGGFGATFEAPAGLAVYPLRGYSADALVEFARADHRNRKLTDGITNYSATFLNPQGLLPKSARSWIAYGERFAAAEKARRSYLTADAVVALA